MKTRLTSFAVGCAVAAVTTPALAANQVVTNSNDLGPGSLRQAMIDVGNGERVSFGPGAGSLISLSSKISISAKTIFIDGPGVGGLSIEAPGNRLFELDNNAIVSVQDLTIANSGNPALSGAIIVEGGASFLATRAAFTGNAAENGGVFRIAGGNLTLVETSFSGNSGRYGGAITVEGNGSESVEINRSEFRGTSTLSCDGSGRGGAVYITTGFYTVTNSLFSGNESSCAGSALAVSGSAIGSVVNSTLAGNYSGNGGALLLDAGGSLTLINSIVAGNATGASVSDVNALAPLGYAGVNLIGDNTGADASFPAGQPNADDQLVGTAAQRLDPLFAAPATASSGSPTSAGNFQLTANSPAINQGVDGNAPGSLDLAGNTRIQSDAVDIGAYESAFATPVPSAAPVPASVEEVPVLPLPAIAGLIAGLGFAARRYLRGRVRA